MTGIALAEAASSEATDEMLSLGVTLDSSTTEKSEAMSMLASARSASS